MVLSVFKELYIYMATHNTETIVAPKYVHFMGLSSFVLILPQYHC